MLMPPKGLDTEVLNLPHSARLVARCRMAEGNQVARNQVARQPIGSCLHYGSSEGGMVYGIRHACKMAQCKLPTHI